MCGGGGLYVPVLVSEGQNTCKHVPDCSCESRAGWRTLHTYRAHTDRYVRRPVIGAVILGPAGQFPVSSCSLRVMMCKCCGGPSPSSLAFAADFSMASKSFERGKNGRVNGRFPEILVT